MNSKAETERVFAFVCGPSGMAVARSSAAANSKCKRIKAANIHTRACLIQGPELPVSTSASTIRLYVSWRSTTVGVQ
jgi:ribosomal protein L28